jgi:hypothetical protein
LNKAFPLKCLRENPEFISIERTVEVSWKAVLLKIGKLAPLRGMAS